ncbi:hypothetical protein [uncultured Brevundimonas sp.]|uniref:hypothetical protein n=1 Tax=uncultured Brevundimonas sp. TaxID=213418 RepID=UPI00261097F8|nr:hypothetical protein [uncultured Brevundimonas sp.]
MAKQETHVRYTIRVPVDLYGKLQKAAGAKSVNAEIVERLERSLELDDSILSLTERIEAIETLASKFDDRFEDYTSLMSRTLDVVKSQIDERVGSIERQTLELMKQRRK